MKHFCLLGENISYSLSPKVHKLIYSELGVNAEYSLFDVASDDFDSNVDKLKDFDGFNITKPYKTRIIKYLDSVADKRFDAVNTVKDGTGYNTDYGGFLKHIASVTNIKGLNALTLGAGGVAKTIVPVLLELGANVSIYNRTHETALKLASESEAYYNARIGAGAQPHQRCMAITTTDQKYDIVINCTSVGLNKGENCALDLDLSKTKVAYDTIYFDTEFLKSAKKTGVPIAANGLGMLVYQAILANEIFFNIEIKDKNLLADKIINQLNLNRQK